MLDQFVTENRQAIIELSQARVALRTSPKPTDLELKDGVPVFLDQLAVALRVARFKGVADHEQLGKSAGRHGHDLLGLGLTIGQVVHDYGDICQSITELAARQQIAVSADEFKILNLCLDDAIAEAVTAYAKQRELTVKNENTERLGMLAHELRNLLNTALLSFESIRSGRVAPGGSTGLLHGRSLMGLRDLIDRSLAEVRLDAGIERLEPLSVADFVEELEIAAAIQAEARGLHFEVSSVDRTLTIHADRHSLTAALTNLLQNAFKFSRAAGHVYLNVIATSDRVLFEVEDACGGLPPGATERLFQPFEQRSADRSGLGLGLAICLKAAKANGGELRVRDLPGKGCVFTLELPRQPPAPSLEVRTQA